MRCPRCETVNEANAAACVSCGAGLPGGAGPGRYVTAETTPGIHSVDATIADNGGSDVGLRSPPEVDLRFGATIVDARPGRVASGISWTGSGVAGAGYTVVRPIGGGGMGQVDLAWDGKLERWVALKRLSVQYLHDTQLQARFQVEAKALAALSHPHIVQVYALGDDAQGPYIALEYVAGPSLPNGTPVRTDWDRQGPAPPVSLQDWVDRAGPLDLPKAIELGIKLCGALGYAHQHGVIHRDVKPANIMLDRDGEPKLTDFGLARQVDRGGDITQPGVPLLTLGYGAPEQEEDASEVDQRADIYALGGTLWFALTRQNPRFFRESQVPAALRPVLVKALEKDRERRYQSTQEFHDALAGLRTQIVSADTVSAACPKCGGVNAPDIKFCTGCGNDLAALFINCPKCKRETRIDMVFCGGCGFDLRVHRQINMLLTSAKELLAAGADEQALRQCEAVLKLDAQQAEALQAADAIHTKLNQIADLRARATELTGQNQLEEAVAAWQDLRALLPTDQEAAGQIEKLQAQIRAVHIFELFEAIQSDLEWHDYQAAEHRCRELLQLDPRNAEAASVLAALPMLRAKELEHRQEESEHLRLRREKLVKKLRIWVPVGVAVVLLITVGWIAGARYHKTREFDRLIAVVKQELAADRLNGAREAIGRALGMRSDDPALLPLIQELAAALCKRANVHASANQVDELRQSTEALKLLLAVAAKPYADDLVEARTFLTQLQAQCLMAEGGILTLDCGNGVQMQLKLIRAGTFTMGSNDKDYEKPPHQVTLSKPFYLGMYEVTQAQWQAVMGSNPSQFKGDLNLPVEHVSWDDCQKFCPKLSEKNPGWTVRLPSEAEWEYACRAGSTSRFSFGDDEKQLGKYGWYDGNSGGKTHPVGTRTANAWGLYDMHGNVWEYCADMWGPYPSGAQRDPVVPIKLGSFCILRGGASNGDPTHCGCAIRVNLMPVSGEGHIGFRVAAGTP